MRAIHVMHRRRRRRIMVGREASHTAQYVAFFRALETRRRAAGRLFADPFASHFLTPPLRMLTGLAHAPLLRGAVQLLVDRRVPGVRASAVARTAIIDDWIATAIGRGVTQVVTLGAGYDCRAYRLPAALAATVFEVDLAVTQRIKQRVIGEMLGSLPDRVKFVPVDLARDDLATAMGAAGLVAGEPTFILWEGVASYLARDTVHHVLDWTRRVAAPGSELVMTYVHRGVVDGSVAFPHSARWIRGVAASGEPFVTGFRPEELDVELARLGWSVTCDISSAEAVAAVGRRVHRVPAFYRLAHAHRAAGTT